MYLSERSTPDRAVDLLLVLCAFDLFDRLKARPPATVLQKAMYWARQGAAQAKHRGSGHHFQRHHFGPYSWDLSADVTLLRSQGFLDAVAPSPTERGRQIARHWRKILEPRNREVFAAQDAMIAERANWTAKKAESEVYSRVRVHVDGRDLPLREVPKGTPMNPSTDGCTPFLIGDEEVEDLVSELSISASDASKAKTRANLSHEELAESAPSH